MTWMTNNRWPKRSRSRHGRRKMNTGFLYQAILLMVSLMLVATPAIGQTVQKPLGDKENPLLIGNRDLNTGQINLYSLDQEIAIGHEFAVEVDRMVKLVNDHLSLSTSNGADKIFASTRTPDCHSPSRI